MEKKVVQIKDINKEANEDFRGFVEACEKTYQNRVEGIADYIGDHLEDIDIVLLSGPSSSGKTTTSHILIEKLEEKGIRSLTVSTDDFFIDRDKVAFKKNGLRDYEALESTNIKLLKSCVRELLTKREAFFPRYDFLTGESIRMGKKVYLREKEIIIIEGIHALNPVITEDPIFQKSLKLYVCVFTNFAYQGIIYLTAIELRLTRRILRDCMTRGATPDYSISMWKNVLDGENKYIKPNIGNADFVIDTTHAYEPLIYKDLILPKLYACENPVPGNLISDYEMFESEDAHVIPKDSLLNEFVIFEE